MAELTPEDYAELFPSASPMDFLGPEEEVINKVAVRLGISPEEVRQTIVDAEEES